MRNRRRFAGAAAALCSVALSACTSGSAEIIESPPISVEGMYESSEDVGPLGKLTMELRLRPNAARSYRAVLLSQSSAGFDESIGGGTLGNDHLILNFDIRAEGDFFFQGFVENEGEAIDSISGTFLFPGQVEELPVTFEYTGELPPLEPEE
jgi:hypothetical protein